MYRRLHFAIKPKIKLYFKLPFSQKKITGMLDVFRMNEEITNKSNNMKKSEAEQL